MESGLGRPWWTVFLVFFLTQDAQSTSAQFRHSEIDINSGNITPALLEPQNETIYIGVLMGVRGLFAGIHDDTGNPVVGLWYRPLVLRAAFESWKDGSVLAPPVDQTDHKYQLLSFDICYPLEPLAGICEIGHVARMALQLALGGDLQMNQVPYLRALIGGESTADLIAEMVGGTSKLPIVDYFSSLESLGDKTRFPTYMRTNTLVSLGVDAVAAVLELYNYTEANGLFCAANDLSETVIERMQGRGVTVYRNLLLVQEYSAWPSGEPQDLQAGFAAHDPVVSAFKKAERTALIEAVTTRHAHVFMNYLSYSCADLDVVFELAWRGGFSGPGYLWVGEQLDEDVLYLYITQIYDFFPWAFGVTSPFYSVKPIDGYTYATSQTPTFTTNQEALQLAVFRLLNNTGELEEWYRDQLEFEQCKCGALWYYNLYYVFDALWAVMLAVNALLLEKGSSFTQTELLSRLLLTDFQGTSGRVRFDSQGNRRTDINLLQKRYCEGCNDTNALIDYVRAGNDFETATVGYYDQTVQFTEVVLFYGRSTTAPPPQDLHCEPGWFYNRPQGVCEACREGRFSRSVAALACELCIPGRMSSAAQQAECQSCSFGSFAPDFGATVCQSCEPGFFSSTIQAQECVPCAAGSFANSSGTKECDLCSPGTANGQEGQTDCADCQRGSSALQFGRSSCQLCEAGRFGDALRATECVACEVGHYSSEQGAIGCIQCTNAQGNTPEYFTTMTFSADEQRWINIDGAAAHFNCGCQRGTHNYTSDGDCELCNTDGLDCPGMGSVVLRAGFYSPAGAPDVYRCYGHPERCPGGLPGETCQYGRFGLSCSRCLPGYTPADNNTCQVCGSFDYIPLILAILFALLACCIVYMFLSRAEQVSRNTTFVVVALIMGQTVTALQQLSVVANLTIDWVAPLSSLLETVKVMALNIDTLRLDCIRVGGPVTSYMGQGTVLIFCAGWFIVIHTVSVMMYNKARFWEHRAALVGSLGILLTVFFMPIVENILGPFQCRLHPNGAWTCRAYPSVRCWDSGDHTTLVALASCSCLLPCAFLATVMRLVWQFPAKLHNVDADFLHTYKFLFFRFRTETYWYILLILFRSLAIGSLPVLPSPIMQLLCMQCVTMVSANASAYFWPWRLWAANAFEVVLACLMVLICTLASFFVLPSMTGRSDIAWGIAGCIALMVCTLPFIFVYSIYHRCIRKARRYKLAICHDRESSGTFVRLLQVCLENLARSTGRKCRLVIDCDIMLDMDGLLNVVANDTEKVVAVVTEPFWANAQCIGQLTAARLKKSNILILRMPNFRDRTSKELLDCADTAEKASVLASSGLSLELIHDTVKLIPELPFISLTQQISVRFMERLSAALNDKQVAPVQFEGDKYVATKVCFIADMNSIECACSAHLLMKLVAPSLALENRLTPHVVPKDTEVDKQVAVAAILLAPGCLEQPSFLETLLGLLGLEMCAIPIVLDSVFVFPTSSQIQEGCIVGIGETDGVRLAKFITHIFKEIACLFHPRTSSMQLLDMHAASIAERLKNPRLLKVKHGSDAGIGKKVGHIGSSEYSVGGRRGRAGRKRSTASASSTSSIHTDAHGNIVQMPPGGVGVTTTNSNSDRESKEDSPRDLHTHTFGGESDDSGGNEVFAAGEMWPFTYV